MKLSPLEKVLECLTEPEILRRIPNLEQRGNEWVGPCPSGHSSESGTCLNVNTDKKVFYCFNCHESGNYIHLLELQRYGTTSKGLGGTDNFMSIVRELADEFGIKFPTSSRNKQVAELKLIRIIDIVVRNYNSQLQMYPQAIEQIKEKWGLTEEFINSEQIGYAGTRPSSTLVKVIDIKDLLSTGLFYKSDKTESGLFHVMHERLTFPYMINGLAHYVIGRKTKSTSGILGKDPPKYTKQMLKSKARPFVSPLVKNVLLKNNLDKDELFLTEGITDYYALKQAGLNTVSAVTNRFKGDDISELIDRCQNKLVYIVFDNDRNRAGNKGAMDTAVLLAKNGISSKTIELPLQDGQDKVDLNGFIKEFGLVELVKLKDQAKNYHYEEVIATEQKRVEEEFYDDERPDIKISPGHDYVSGYFYRTITKQSVEESRQGVKTTNTPYVIRSDRRILNVDDYLLIEDGGMYTDKLSNKSEFDKWSLKDGKYSVYKYMKGEIKLTPREVYDHILEIVKDHIYFKKESHYTLLTVACMTYPIYMIFNTIGYIQLYARKRSGKSTVLDLIEHLCCNAIGASSMSDASMFRMIGKYRPLLLLDEAENLNPSKRARELNPSERLEITKSGYKRGQDVYRFDMEVNESLRFDNFAPRVIAGTNDINDILADRVIRIDIERKPPSYKVKDFSKTETKSKLLEARDMITSFGMIYANRLREIYLYDPDINGDSEYLRSKGIEGRNWEITVPFLAMARLIDGPSSQTILCQIIKSQIHSVQNKAEFNVTDPSMDILEQLYLFLKKKKAELIYIESIKKDWYPKKIIARDFISSVLHNEEEFGDRYKSVTINSLINDTLRNCLVVKIGDQRRQRCPVNDMDRPLCVRIPLDRLLRALREKDYLDEEIENDYELMELRNQPMSDAIKSKLQVSSNIKEELMKLE